MAATNRSPVRAFRCGRSPTILHYSTSPNPQLPNYPTNQLPSRYFSSSLCRFESGSCKSQDRPHIFYRRPVSCGSISDQPNKGVVCVLILFVWIKRLEIAVMLPKPLAIQYRKVHPFAMNVDLLAPVVRCTFK